MAFPFFAKQLVSFLPAMAGQTPIFTVYKRADTLADMAPPGILEVGSGLYCFEHLFSLPTDPDVLYQVDLGTGVADAERYRSGHLRLRDYYDPEVAANTATLVVIQDMLEHNVQDGVNEIMTTLMAGQGQAPYVSFTATGETVRPVIAKVVAPQRNQLLVTFSEAVQMTGAVNGALNMENYEVPRLRVLGARSVTNSQVLLTTSTQVPGSTYTLTIRNIEDLQGNVIGATA